MTVKGWYTVVVRGVPRDVWKTEQDAQDWAEILNKLGRGPAEVRAYLFETDAMVARYSPQLNA